MMLLGRMLGEGKVEVSYSLTGNMNKIPNNKRKRTEETMYSVRKVLSVIPIIFNISVQFLDTLSKLFLEL